MKKKIPVDEGIIASRPLIPGTKDYRMVRRAILKHYHNKTPDQKRKNKFFSIKLRLEDYLETGNPEFMITQGQLLKKLVRLYKIRIKILAAYIGISESKLSSIIAGRKTINNDLALKLGNIFSIRPEHWINLQYKNDLLALNNESTETYIMYKLEDLLNKE
jgi:addiction module HigA family antidote